MKNVVSAILGLYKLSDDVKASLELGAELNDSQNLVITELELWKQTFFFGHAAQFQPTCHPHLSML